MRFLTHFSSNFLPLYHIHLGLSSIVGLDLMLDYLKKIFHKTCIYYCIGLTKRQHWNHSKVYFLHSYFLVKLRKVHNYRTLYHYKPIYIQYLYLGMYIFGNTLRNIQKYLHPYIQWFCVYVCKMNPKNPHFFRFFQLDNGIWLTTFCCFQKFGMSCTWYLHSTRT